MTTEAGKDTGMNDTAQTAAPAQAALAKDLREKILSAPEMILEDRDLMRALIAGNERTMGGNIVDLRGIAMERLERETLERCDEALAGRPVLVKSHDPRLRAQTRGVRFG